MEVIKDIFGNAELVPMLVAVGGKLVLALLIYIIGKWIAKKIANTVSRLMEARDVKGDILEQAKVELEAAGLNIPYPQTDVHLHQVS